MRVFIGTTIEQKDAIPVLVRHLKRAGFEVLPWLTAFKPGEYNLEALFRAVTETDAAVFLMTLDDKRWFRGKKDDTPRDNLIFEAGLWMSKYGRRRVFLVVPLRPSQKLGLPTDLSGLTVPTSKLRAGGRVAKSLDGVAKTICKNLKAVSGVDPEPLRLHPKLKAMLSSAPDEASYIETVVAPWPRARDPIASAIGDKQTDRIDILAAYQLGEILRGAKFRTNKKACLRVCLSNMYDDTLLAAYMRKYADPNHTDSLVRATFEKSLKEAVGDQAAKIVVAPHTKLPRLKTSRSYRRRARVEVYVTSQRIATSYYRANDLSWVIPLDAKKGKDPAPMCWGISRDASAAVWEKYAEEFEAVIGEAHRVYP